MTAMLPVSCDPGYGELGVQVGVSDLRQAGRVLRHQLGARRSTCPSSASSRSVRRSWTARTPRPSRRYSAIGQETCRHRAAERHGGRGDRQRRRRHDAPPHVVDPRLAGALVKSYAPKPMPTFGLGRRRAGGDRLMEGVPTSGTASGVGFPSYLSAAVKTGTAQTEPDAG